MSTGPARRYRTLLRLLPRDLRDTYGPEMERVFLEQLETCDGRWDRTRTWVGALADVLRWAVKERLPGRRTSLSAQGSTSPWSAAAPAARQPARRLRLDGLVQDVRYAGRVLRRQPAFAIVVIAVASLGIGANTAIFTVVNELVLEPLPVEDPQTLVDVVARVPGGNSFTGFSFDDFRDIRERADALADVAAFTATRRPLGRMGEGERLTIQMHSPNYFDMLGLQAHLGRLDFPEFRGFGADPVAVMSHALWVRSYGADPGVIGSTLDLGGQAFTVIGIAPASFRGTFIGFPVDLWVPLSMAPVLLPSIDVTSRAEKRFELLGRLHYAGGAASVEAQLERVLAQAEEEHPEANRGLRAAVYPTTGIDHSMRTGVLVFLGVLTAVALLVLLIACLNIGSLLLSRAVTRDREIAIRLAVGAGRGRVVRQFVTEALVLVGLATVVAVALGQWLVRRLQAFATSNAVPIGLDLGLDHRVLTLTVLVAFLAAVAAAAAPALHGVRKSPAGALRTTGASSGGRPRLRASFVVAQVAASVVLLIGAGLFVQALRSGLALDVGFDAEQVASVSVTLDRSRFGDPEQARAFGLAALEAAREAGGVERVALAAGPPVQVARTPTLVRVPGHEPPPEEDGFFLDARRVGSGYFDVLGLPLVFGRPLTVEDEAPSASVVVSEAFARRFWDEVNPLGRFIDVEGEPHQIVGVAADVRYLIQDPSPDPILYLPWDWNGAASLTVLARADGDAASVALSLADAVASLDPSLPPRTGTTVAATLRQALLPQRVAVAVLGVLGALGLLLTSVGVYGVVQFSVSRARQELGVRMALGGDAKHVAGIVLRRGFLYLGIGAALGVVGALLSAPLLDAFLVGVSPADPATYAGVALVLAGVGLVASGIPALRALRIDPARALRAE